MPSRLPLVDPHAREHTYCAYCPKLCRFSCPVSTVQGRETTTPWGKMTSLHHVAEGALPMDRSHAATWWACTGCMRCRTFCDHGNEVAATLAAGRAEAVRSGAAPGPAYDVIDRHPERQERAARAARALFGDDALERSASTAFVPGCTACVLTPEAAANGLEATRALSDGPVRVEADMCCGLPLLEAGDRDGFQQAARRFLERLQGADRVVFQDPGCLHALRLVAPRMGIESERPLVHLMELAAERLSRLRPVEVTGPVRWHDPCRLGRGLGVYDAPRAVLARMLGAPPHEFPQHRERAECSGAGGQLPRTDPHTAHAIAEERLDAHRQHGGGTVVTGCPASGRALRAAAGEDTEVVDAATLLARSALP
ncbi:MAG: (Fe-S)-binding protein [Myxococcota bacterium]